MMFGKSHLMSELESFVSGKASQVLLKWIRFQVFFRQRLKRFESNGVVMIQKRWRQIRYLRRAMVLIRCCLAKIRMHRLACVCFVQREIRRFRARRSWKEACDLLNLKEKERLEIERRKSEEERRKKEEERRKREEERRKREEERRKKEERERLERERRRKEEEEKKKKKRKQRPVSQRTLVRRRLESLQDAEMGLSKTYVGVFLIHTIKSC